MGFNTVAAIKVFATRVEGMDNERISKACLSWRDRKIDPDPDNTGNEDSRMPDDPEIKKLEQKIIAICHATFDDRYYLGETWAHILGPNESTMIHSHRAPKDTAHLFLSWVYYPQLPLNMKGGTLRFHMQMHNQSMTHEEKPDLGKLCFFPSWLPHYTTKNASDGDRISISGNFKIKDELYESVRRDKQSGIHDFYR